jgi:membrane protein required for colicin V production
MNGVDVALVLALVAFAFQGYRRGFFRESFGLLALIAGVGAALQFTQGAAGMAEERLSLPPVVEEGVAFVAIFVVAYTVVNLIGVVLDRLAGASRLWLINCLAGAMLGIAKGGVLLAAALLFLHLLPIVPGADEQIMGSAVARPLVAAASDVLQRGGREAQPGSPSRT